MAYSNERIVTIATFSNIVEATLARGALEAIGIRCLVPGESQGSFSRYRGAPETAVLQVFEHDRERAVTELRRLQIRLVE
jgi:hypothetical protein